MGSEKYIIDEKMVLIAKRMHNINAYYKISIIYACNKMI